MNQERWQKFSRYNQIRHIGAECERARIAEEAGNTDLRRGALKRALELIDCSLLDPQWQEDILQLRILREEISKFENGERHDPVAALGRML